MSQQQVPVAYPAPAKEYNPSPPPPHESYPPVAPPQPVVAQYDQGHNNNYQVPYVAAPPPAGYPTNSDYGPSGFPHQTSHAVPIQTNSKGEGFWKGCVAALCCCWVLDVCCC